MVGITHEGLNASKLREFLVSAGVEVTGELTVDLISGGRSNLTFGVRDDNSHWVVRRPPLTGLTPSAHDMKREWTVTAALQATNVPVAQTIAADLSGEVLGAPFTVVNYIAGGVIRTKDDLAAVSDTQIEAQTNELIATLVNLHAVDYQKVGLAEFGRPTGFAGRQVKTWARQWDLVKTRELADAGTLIKKLTEQSPENGDSAIVHGDFRIDNTIVAQEDPTKVIAVVDWEMSTLGDPLTDIALMIAYQQPFFDVVLGTPSAWTSPRYPDDLAERYAKKSGREMANWPFYVALANFKIGVIGEGITHRALQGSDAGSGATKAAEVTAEFFAAGLRALGE